MNNYNGYKNRDTWLVVLWLNNDEKNYRKLIELRPKDLLHLKIPQLQRHFSYGDDINWSKVSLKQIHENILETIENLL